MKNKVVLVTGASRGIGRQIAIDLAKSGYNVIANYNHSVELAQSLQNDLKKENIFIDIFKADVSIRDEVKKLVEYILNKYHKIDVIINNAGISQSKLFMDITDNDWNTIINANLYSNFCVTQECLPNMIHNKSGCIINISSMWGLVGASLESIYSVSKAGIDALTKSLSKELGPSNIRVNSIAPGFILTDMNKQYSNEDIINIEKETPLEKVGKPHDISKCVKWLIEDDFTTGQIISINGGLVII